MHTRISHTQPTPKIDSMRSERLDKVCWCLFFLMTKWLNVTQRPNHDEFVNLSREGWHGREREIEKGVRN